MIGEKMDSQEILNRLMSAYGVSSQKSLAEALAIPANNISGWLQRGSVPGNPIIKCALDTGTDLRWLVTGKFANANLGRVAFKSVPSRSEQGKVLIEKMLSTGGKAVLQRVMNAYGFTTQKELSEYLGISTGTISTWVRREYFPGDLVIACALDTGMSLRWLATGSGAQDHSPQVEICGMPIPKKNLISGVLHDCGKWNIDFSFIPQKINEPVFIISNTNSWVVDMGLTDISNGRWLLGINDKYDIYDIALLPGKKISVTGKLSSFISATDEVETAGKVIITFDYNF